MLKGASPAAGRRCNASQRKKKRPNSGWWVARCGIAGPGAVALQQNNQPVYSPSQIADGDAPVDTRIRAGGLW